MSKYRSVRVCTRFNPHFPGFQSGGKAVTLRCSLDETEVHSWNNRKGHELWLLWGIEKEEPFNFLDNLKPFTWKNCLDKGIWLHLFSNGIIVWTEMKSHIYIILCHSAEEVETTAYSLYCLLFIPHCLLVERQLCQLEACPALPRQSQPAPQSNVTNLNEWAESFIPEGGERCHHWSIGDDHEAQDGLVLFRQGAGGNI